MAGIAPRELDFPYYNLRDGFQSTLLLVSDSPKPMDFTLGVRASTGQMLTTSETIQPGAKLSIDLASVITQLGGDPMGVFGEGSVAVYYIGTIMPIVGQISIRNPQLSLEHESEMVENDPGRSDVPAVLNGVWWGLGAGRQASIMVTNVGGDPAVAEVHLDFQGKQHPLAAPLTFAPGETKVLDVAQLLASIGADPLNVPEGGITITQAGPHPSLIASGKITDPAMGFSSTMDFPLPELERVSALHATGLPVGTPSKDSPFAGTGTFVPRVVVRNLVDSPQNVTITVEYPVAPSAPVAAASPAPPTGAAARYVIPPAPVPGDNDDHPEWGSGTGSTTRTLKVGSLVVRPYSTEDFSLASAMDQLPLPLPFCSIRIQYSGTAGSLEAQVASVEVNSSMVVDARVENEGNGWAGSGANPWHLDAQTESILFLTNESDKPARIGFSVTASGVHYYLTMLKLNPHETRAINIRALRDAQFGDFKGRKIPFAAADGSVNWIRIDNVPVMGRLMVISRRSSIAATYDCCVSVCPPVFLGVVSMDNPIFALTPGNSLDCTCSGEYEDYNSNVYWNNVTSLATWSSDNTAVAVMDSTVPSQVDEVGYGFADITAWVTDCHSYQYISGGEGNPCECTGTTSGSDSSQDINSLTSSQHTYPSGPFAGCRVSNPFDAIINTITKAKHSAQDVVATGVAVGSAVYAVEGGTIATHNGGEPHDNRATKVCAGQHDPVDYVIITQSDGAQTGYYHVTLLSTLSDKDPVATGDQIGTVDLSGCTGAPHTHIQRKVNGVLVNFTLPCDNSHFDDASTWYDDGP